MLNLSNYRLREIGRDDLLVILNWRNSDRIRKVMYNDNLISIDEHKAWYKKIKGDSNYLGRVFELNKKPIGFVNFSNFDKINNRCFWGFYIGEENAPPKSGLVMGYFALKLIFEELKIRKLCSEAFDSNIKSLNYHYKLGFFSEGRYLEHVQKNGKYEDVIPLAHFKEKWPVSKSNLERVFFDEK